MKIDDNKQEAQEIRPPSWMSKPERRLFLAAIGERSAGNGRLSAEEVDVLADYVSARSRLATLHKIWRKTIAEAKDGFRRDDDLLKISRQIDAAVASARRLAKGGWRCRAENASQRRTRVW